MTNVGVNIQVSMNVEIKKPSIDLVPSYLQFMDEMKARGETIWDGYYPAMGESHEGFVARLLSREIQPGPSGVPESVYWGVVGETVIGRISLRHELRGSLLIIGGNIGYEVHPGFRKRGFATAMLREILKTPKAQEIGRLLLTCHPDNIGSNKTIQSNGGVLERKVFVDFIGEYRNHYWITVKKAVLF